jgi:hypothetical protein
MRDPQSSSAPSITDNEESVLFERLLQEGKYERKGKGAKSYRAFEQRWNGETACRFRLWSQGDETTIQIHYKSRSQLEQHYDRLQEIGGLRAVQPADDPDRDQLDQQFKESRSSLPVTRIPIDVVPPVYPNLGGGTPFGNPRTLNNTITVGILDGTNAGIAVNGIVVAPYSLLPTRQLPDEPQRPPPRKIFRSRRFCITCAFKRSDHDSKFEGIGKTCTRNYCGNCRWLKEHHDEAMGFGETCTRETHPWCRQDKEQWYDLKN